jgi:hypothetical protein
MIQSDKELIDDLETALDDLLTLARQYAQLLNMYDEGQRTLPETTQEWLKCTKRLKHKKKVN